MARQYELKIHPTTAKGTGRPNGYVMWLPIREGKSLPCYGATVADVLRAAAQIADNFNLGGEDGVE